MALRERLAQKEHSFNGKVFYLDLRNMPALKARIVNGIRFLNGTIDEFLGSDVRYIVTDKKEEEWPGKVPALNSTKNRDVNEPDLHDHVSNSSLTMVQPQPSVQTVQTSGVEAFSRGKLLLARASNMPAVGQAHVTAQSIFQKIQTPYKANTCDVLDVAVRRGIKLISANRMVKFLIDNVEDTRRGTVTENDSPSKMRSIKVVMLDTPYIKVDVNDHKHRPFYRKLQKWPDINFDSTSGSPFIATRPNNLLNRLNITTSNQVNHDANQPTTTTTNLEGLVVKRPPDNVQEDRFRKTMFKSKRRKSSSGSGGTRLVHGNNGQVISMGGGHDETTNRPALAITTTPKLKKKKADMIQVLVQQQQAAAAANVVKRKAVQYCEVCAMEYDNINQHVRSDKHEAYANNEDNFKELTSVLQSLPTLSDLDGQVELDSRSTGPSSQHSLSGVHDEYQFTSTPPTPSSQTFTLTSLTSRPGGKFIQLHELMKKRHKSANETKKAAIGASGDKFTVKPVNGNAVPDAGINGLKDEDMDEEDEEATSAYDFLISPKTVITPRLPPLVFNGTSTSTSNVSNSTTPTAGGNFTPPPALTFKGVRLSFNNSRHNVKMRPTISNRVTCVQNDDTMISEEF